VNDIDIPITLKAGVEWGNGQFRYRVLSHIYGQKPRFKWIGPSIPIPPRVDYMRVTKRVKRNRA
jgi:hypothetical protein